MPSRHLSVDTAPPEPLLLALERLREELEIDEDFPADVLAEADRSAARLAGGLPGAVDARDVPVVTIDPPGSRDLDQALHLARAGAGYHVRYAIAAVPEAVEPGGALDAEVHRRGVTAYGPDGSFPLHPPALSADAASLLPGGDRPAYLWHLDLDAAGLLSGARLEVATVRSRAQLTYAQVQAAHDGEAALPADVPADLPELLAAVGGLRQERERDRGGVSLDLPDQGVERTDHGFRLTFRRTLPVEGWNAQLSLATGIAAGRMMREAGVGILRTLPPADDRDVARLRRTARALGVRWPEGTSYAELLRTLDSAVPAQAAFLGEATSLFRGAGYLPLDGRAADDHQTQHSAIAADYAHVTAPLRRLVDRYGLAVCLALSTGIEAPAWALAALPDLPATMAATTQRANAYERGAVDALEALVLKGRVGEVFAGVVVDVHAPRDGGPADRGTVVIGEPAVRGLIEGLDLPLGEAVDVRLVEADVVGHTVRFELA